MTSFDFNVQIQLDETLSPPSTPDFSFSSTPRTDQKPAIKRQDGVMVKSKKMFHWFRLGLMKLRPEMEMKDIKTRQSRRKRLVVGGGGGGDTKVIRSWRIIDSLSCKADVDIVSIARTLKS